MRSQSSHLPSQFLGLFSFPRTLEPAAGQRALTCRAALVFLLLATLTVCSANALAEKPEGVGQGKFKVQGKAKEDKAPGARQAKRQGGAQEDRPSGGGKVQISIAIGGYFQPQQRTAVQTYYGPIVQSGRCPPGLAKKNKGCLPPGQAKAYSLGRPLPPQVIFYDLPSSVSLQMGLPPAGHRYVRLAADILLIAVGTGLVVDAIQDLGRL